MLIISGINVVRTLPKTTHKFSAIPSKVAIQFLTELFLKNHKCHIEAQKTIYNQNTTEQ